MGESSTATQTEEQVEQEQPVHWYWGLGRRKTAVARVRIRPGNGRIVVNKRTLEDYFDRAMDRQQAVRPLETVEASGEYDVYCNVDGGGFTGQAGAIRLGLARALVEVQPELEDPLRDAGHLTRDPRMKERKKYGQKGARASFQFSKR